MDTTGLSAAIAPVGEGQTGNGAGASAVIDVGYGGGLTSDVAAFGDSLSAAAARLESGQSQSVVTETLMKPLGAIDREADALGSMATDMQASGNEMTPSELVTLTMHSQEFMFHSQLTSNIANRTADGLQQLFRQQG